MRSHPILLSILLAWAAAALLVATPVLAQVDPTREDDLEAAPEPTESAAEDLTQDEEAVDEDAGGAPAPAEEIEAELARRYGRKAKVAYRRALNDRQDAAARPSDFVLDPEFRGFIPIPETVFLMKINIRPRIDMLASSAASGSEFRFVPALFYQEGQPGYADTWRFKGNANGSQIRVDFRAPSAGGNFRLYYQNDFFGSDQSPMRYRLQHLYGQYHGLVAGFTFGLFENPDAWPDTVDYEGPNSVVFARRALVHYQKAFGDQIQVTIGLENPDVYVDTNLDDPADGQWVSQGSGRAQAPDGGFNVRWTPGDLGHMQFSTIFRSIGIDPDQPQGATTPVSSQNVFGWGVNLSGAVDMGENDALQYWFVYGQGVGGMGNDTSFLNSDAALQQDGTLVALEYWSAMAALTHKWTPRLRSIATYGYVNLENTSGQDPATAYHASHYATANVIYQIFKRFSVGLEGMYGRQEVADGSAVDVFRVQVGLSFSIFD
jgi:hypothetical protein